MTINRTDIQIRFADVDMLRHVNNVNLQHYFDFGKSEFFRMIFDGFTQHGEGQELITASTATNYFIQTRYEDKIHVETQVEKIGNKSFTLMQRIINNATGAVHAESHTVMVAFNFTTQHSVTIPDRWRRELEEAMEVEVRSEK